MRTVLLLHGALGSASQLATLKVSLEAQGYTAHSLNFSGHNGEAFRATFGIEAFSDDVLQFMTDNKIAKADIFGYSMGGYVALWFALHQPSRVGKIVTLGTKFDWSEESAAHEVKKMNPEKIEEKIPAFARVLERRHAPNDWRDLLHRTAAMMTGLGKNPLLTETLLAKLSTVTTILLGDQDDMADRNYSHYIAGVLPKGTFRLLENTPHPIEKVSLDLLVPLLVEVFQES